MNQGVKADAPTLIECRNVWKIFGPHPARALQAIQRDETETARMVASGHMIAVRDVSFTVRRGETFVVMGLSGSGKSTLVRCISRLSDPTSGEILIDGRDILPLDDAAMRDVRRHTISMVFQNFGLLPHRRVIDNVAFGLEVRGADRAQRLEHAANMIRLVGLAGWEHRYPRELSGGMQQRVGLARALAVDPEILLFDEPFSALDPLIRREMQDELIRLQSTLHKTSIFITHDFDEALRLGDRIAIMRNGTFVQIGTPQQLVSNPHNDYVRAFVQDAPRGKILTCGAIMTPCEPGFDAEGLRSVTSDTALDDVLPLVVASDEPVTVRGAEGRPDGVIDRLCVLRALAST